MSFRDARVALESTAAPTLVIPLSGVSTSEGRAAVRRALAVRGALAILGAWTLYGLVHAGFWMATGQWKAGEWPPVVATSLILAWSWAALTPLIFRLTKAFAPSRVGWFWSLLVHGLTIALLALGMTWLRSTLITTLSPRETRPLLQLVVFWFDVTLFTYLTVVLTGWAIQSHRRYVDRALRAHVLETQLARAQLHYLELQLQPHFLFNSLNAIQELAHEAPDAAERMLRRLYALLSMSLERSGRDEVSLRDELSALEPYADIQRARFEWLGVSVRADDAARTALVPHLILQPLVENAIRHGLAVRRGPGHIQVIAECQGDRLLLQVRDDGVGLAPIAARGRTGIGLRNAGERLRQLYGSDHRFELREVPGGGVLVEIDIPYREASEAPAEPALAGAVRGREPDSEFELDEMASWRTGEFVAPLHQPNEPAGFHAAGHRTPAPDGTPIAPLSVATATTPSGAPATSEEPAPEEHSPPIFTLRTWLALVGVWLGAAALWTGQLHLFARMDDPTYTRFDPEILRLQVAGAMYWIAVSLGVVYLARRFRLHRRRLVPHLALHVGAALALSFGFLFVLTAVRLTAQPVLGQFNINPLSGNFFVYFGLLAWSHSRDFVAWYRARELTAAQLTSDIARSRFQALCVQVRPQFLLGTLDLLARLVHLDVPRADRLIARLADVLRLTLEMARESVASLDRELQLLGVTVEAHRLGVRPAVTLETDIDPAALATMVPSRLLCTMVDDLLSTDAHGPAVPLVVRVRAERAPDATRIRLHGDAAWKSGSADLHAWWRKKSAAEAAVADAGPLVTVAFPDRATAVVIIFDELPADAAAAA